VERSKAALVSPPSKLKMNMTCLENRADAPPYISFTLGSLTDLSLAVSRS